MDPGASSRPRPRVAIIQTLPRSFVVGNARDRDTFSRSDVAETEVKVLLNRTFDQKHLHAYAKTSLITRP